MIAETSAYLYFVIIFVIVFVIVVVAVRNTFTVGIFYALPAFQLVLSEQQVCTCMCVCVHVCV